MIQTVKCSYFRSQPESVLANDSQENIACSSAANAIEKVKGKTESSSQSRDLPRDGSFGEVSDRRYFYVVEIFSCFLLALMVTCLCGT